MPAAADISLEMLLGAYAQGLFPMARGRHGRALYWYDPDWRGVLPLEDFHVPRRLARTLRTTSCRVTFDTCFEEVIRACADMPRKGGWINDGIIALYTQAHKAGFAHSVEVWQDGLLAGGLYGLALGGAFFGESMFSRQRDASKIALVHLAARLRERGFTLLDAQFYTPHLAQFGMKEISRADYQSRLSRALAQEGVVFKGPAPVFI